MSDLMNAEVDLLHKFVLSLLSSVNDPKFLEEASDVVTKRLALLDGRDDVKYLLECVEPNPQVRSERLWMFSGLTFTNTASAKKGARCCITIKMTNKGASEPVSSLKLVLQSNEDYAEEVETRTRILLSFAGHKDLLGFDCKIAKLCDDRPELDTNWNLLQDFLDYTLLPKKYLFPLVHHAVSIFSPYMPLELGLSHDFFSEGTELVSHYSSEESEDGSIGSLDSFVVNDSDSIACEENSESDGDSSQSNESSSSNVSSSSPQKPRPKRLRRSGSLELEPCDSSTIKQTTSSHKSFAPKKQTKKAKSKAKKQCNSLSAQSIQTNTHSEPPSSSNRYQAKCSDMMLELSESLVYKKASLPASPPTGSPIPRSQRKVSPTPGSQRKVSPTRGSPQRKGSGHAGVRKYPQLHPQELDENHDSDYNECFKYVSSQQQAVPTETAPEKKSSKQKKKSQPASKQQRLDKFAEEDKQKNVQPKKKKRKRRARKQQ